MAEARSSTNRHAMIYTCHNVKVATFFVLKVSRPRNRTSGKGALRRPRKEGHLGYLYLQDARAETITADLHLPSPQ